MQYTWLIFIFKMIDTTLSIAHVRIHEPVTAFTDFIIFVLAAVFYIRLKAMAKNEKHIKNWAYFFLLLGFSTCLGGCSHAFFLIHEGWQYKSIWLSTQLLNGLAVYFAQQATLTSVLSNSEYKKNWQWSFILQLILFIIVQAIIQKYTVSIIENALGLIPIMILHYMHEPKMASYKKIAHGIAIAFVSATVHITKFSIHRYFNHNDIAHVFIAMSLYVMYKGVKEGTFQNV